LGRRKKWVASLESEKINEMANRVAGRQGKRIYGKRKRKIANGTRPSPFGHGGGGKQVGEKEGRGSKFNLAIRTLVNLGSASTRRGFQPKRGQGKRTAGRGEKCQILKL